MKKVFHGFAILLVTLTLAGCGKIPLLSYPEDQEVFLSMFEQSGRLYAEILQTKTKKRPGEPLTRAYEQELDEKIKAFSTHFAQNFLPPSSTQAIKIMEDAIREDTVVNGLTSNLKIAVNETPQIKGWTCFVTNPSGTDGSDCTMFYRQANDHKPELGRVTISLCPRHTINTSSRDLIADCRGNPEKTYLGDKVSFSALGLQLAFQMHREGIVFGNDVRNRRTGGIADNIGYKVVEKESIKFKGIATSQVN